MTRDEFITLIQAYGVSPSRWPEDRQAEGTQFLSEFPEDAQLIMAEDAVLDEFLNLSLIHI